MLDKLEEVIASIKAAIEDGPLPLAIIAVVVALATLAVMLVLAVWLQARLFAFSLYARMLGAKE